MANKGANSNKETTKKVENPTIEKDTSDVETKDIEHSEIKESSVKDNSTNVEEIKSTSTLSREELKKALKESRQKGLKQKRMKTKTVEDVEREEAIKRGEIVEDEEEMNKKKKKSFLSFFSKKNNDKLEEEENLRVHKKFDNAVRFVPDIDVGLKEADIAQRKKEDLTNENKYTGTKTYWQIFYTNVCTFFNFLLLVIFIALMAVQKYSDCFFMIIAIANTVIGVIQEVRAKKTIDKLKLVTAPSALVMRDGELKSIPTEEIVLDDIMHLSTGNQIGADAIIKQGNLEVNESLLTGESLPIKKAVGDMVLAGSFVVSGSAICQVDRVSSLCYASTIQQKAKKYVKPKSELVRSLNLIIKSISFAIIPIGAILFWLNFNSSPAEDIWGVSGKVAEAISKTAGSLIGMIPAGLVLLTSLALAAGIVRLSKSKTLVQELYCIEMLARVNTLCLDKTGTLTDGTMKVSEVLVFDKDSNLNDIMGSYLSSFEESNQTSIALNAYYPESSAYRAINTIPFSSARKFSAVSFENNGTYVLGAPEYVYKGNDEEVKSLIASRQKKGFRVMMLAHLDTYIENGQISGKPKVVAVFVLIDHIRKEAPETIKWFNDNGVEIKIISGDNPYTASNIAQHCGVIDADKCVSLEGVSIQETIELANRFTVFGRVSPEQKAALVQAFKTHGRTVGMTGDGVNDILAMKNADCSIAMASGADAAKNVAHLVLLDSNFASMPKVVEEGRRVINNIQQSSSLFLMKTIFTIALTLFVIVYNLSSFAAGTSQIQYPFSPKNLILMELFGIGIPSFFLALQPNKNLIRGNFLKNTFLRAAPGSIMMLAVLGILALFNMNNFFELVDGNRAYTILTMQVIGILIVAIGMLIPISKPFNIYRGVLFIAMVVCVTVAVFVVPETIIGIDYRHLNKICWLVVILMVFAVPVLTVYLESIFSLLRDDIDHQSIKDALKIFKRKKKTKVTNHDAEGAISPNPQDLNTNTQQHDSAN